MKSQLPKEGFVYLWKDTKRNKFYLGSHLGSPADGYTGSNDHFQSVYKRRPHTFRRRILEHYVEITSRDLLNREAAWLHLINPSDLGKKYYNFKKVAAGGDIISFLSEEKRQQHREKSIANLDLRYAKLQNWRENNPELVKQNAKVARSKVEDPGKNFKIKEQLDKRSEIEAFMTPLGPRSFLTKAAAEFGISYPTLRKYVDAGINGFYWITKTVYFYK